MKKKSHPSYPKQKSKHAIASVFILAIFISLIALGNVNSKEKRQTTIAGNSQLETVENSEIQGTQVQNSPIDNQQPNIVVILTDDQAALDGRLLNYMPSIKNIFINRGTTFNDFHSSTPLCCPARANLLTGQHSHNHKQTSNSGMKLNATITLATQLQNSGYYTFLVGKYLNPY